MSNQNIARHVPADTGPSYWGPGDRYTFLVTGAQTNGAYFIFEAIVPPGGGPPPHTHSKEDEGIYILEGAIDVTMGNKQIKAKVGDFVHLPRGIIHAFRNAGSEQAKMLVLFTPAGMEKFFEEVLEPVKDRSATPPPMTDALMGRFLVAATKNGIEFSSH